MSQVSVRQAAELTGKSRDTINVATNNGTLSCERNAQGHKRIDVAELGRVFPLIKKPEEIDHPTAAVRSGPKRSDVSVREELARLLERIKHREEVNETQRLERAREREQLLSEIDNLRGNLKKAQEQHSQALLLITDGRENKGDRLEAIQAQISEQGSRFEELLSDAKEEARREAIQDVRSRPWWELVFGSKLSA